MGGEIAVIEVALFTVNEVAAVPPKDTEVAPLTKPVPVIVTVVPPALGPDDGEETVRVGTAS